MNKKKKDLMKEVQEVEDAVFRKLVIFVSTLHEGFEINQAYNVGMTRAFVRATALVYAKSSGMEYFKELVPELASRIVKALEK